MKQLAFLLFAALGVTAAPTLPKKIIVGYAPNCDERVVTAVKEGVNVVIWAFIDLAASRSGQPEVHGGPDRACVQRIKSEIEALKLETIHLISVGGWAAPHPTTVPHVADTYNNWKAWNNGLYDGIDWDLEGTNDVTSPFNHITPATLDVMGAFSQFAKIDGFIVTLVPCESYFDPTTSEFDRSLLHTYREWENAGVPFAYHGRNPFVYIYSKYALTQLISGPVVNTFDFVSVQFYETFAHALFNVTRGAQSFETYLPAIVRRFQTGWNVDFGSDPAMRYSSRRVQLEPQRLVIGLANGWAASIKTLLLSPQSIKAANDALLRQNLEPLGYMFWSISEEGSNVRAYSDERGSAGPLWLAKGLNSFMRVRATEDSENSEISENNRASEQVAAVL